MKFLQKGFLFLTLLTMPVIVFAQELSQITDIQFLEELLKFIGGVKGAGSLAVVAGVVQLVMYLIQAPFFAKLVPKLSGAKKLLIVSGLSVIGGLIALMSEGHQFLAALMHSTTLAALQVFANQLIQQFSKKEEVKE